MRQGYVKLWRKSIDSEVFQNPNLWRFWSWCLMMASHREKWVEVRTGKGTTQVQVKPGQFIFGRNFAAKQLKVPPSSIRNMTLLLKKAGNVDILKDSHYSILTIRNWKEYQSTEKEKGQPEGQPKDNQRTLSKNVKNIYILLREFFPDENQDSPLISAALCIIGTRKTDRISENVLKAEFEYWAKYSIVAVRRACIAYINKNPEKNALKESYLRAIIRNEEDRCRNNPPKDRDPNNICAEDWF